MSREFLPQESSELRHDLLVPDEGNQAAVRLAVDFIEIWPERTREPEIDTEEGSFPSTNRRITLHNRDQAYRLSEPEIRMIAELGKFRVIAEYDLARYFFGGHVPDAKREIKSLVRRGLAKKGSYWGADAGSRELLTLTRQGHELLSASQLVPSDQIVYHGFAKPKDVSHDADLFCLYQKEAIRIHSEGGKNLRVILDYELKGKINRDLAFFGSAAKPEIAERYGLPLVDGKIPVPDLRIEHETADGELARVDLELITEHYAFDLIAEKVRAGFSLFTRRGGADRLRRVLDQRRLSAEIQSL